MIIDTILYGQKVVLVPYKAEHVSTYHGWMESESLRELTASDRLTLEEEYEMQKKWRLDEDKLTFIILARTFDANADLTSQPLTGDDVANLPMVGDVNLFLKGIPPQMRATAPKPNTNKTEDAVEEEEEEEENFEAELEIMIAEPAYRRQGLAYEALQLLISYATKSSTSFTSTSEPTTSYPPQLPIPHSSLVARISDSNMPSIKLLESLGMRIVKHVKVFQEVEMRWFGV